MSLNIRPTDVRAVAAMLQDEHPDVQSLAKDVIRLVYAQLETRMLHYIVAREQHGDDDESFYYYVFGPYPTWRAAMKAKDKAWATAPSPAVVARSRTEIGEVA